MAIKYKTSRESAGRYSVHITDERGEYPQRVGYIVGGRDNWLAESGPESLGYHTTKKKALQAIIDHRAAKTAAGEPVTITTGGAQA